MHFLYTDVFTKILKDLFIFMSEINHVFSHMLSLFGFRVRLYWLYSMGAVFLFYFWFNKIEVLFLECL